ncbi:MAG: hypothetical protein K2X91_00795, partial [Thermoleophilia bacterium]|nr:hypothetical protein [Thermoleophilia bacterium]
MSAPPDGTSSRLTLPRDLTTGGVPWRKTFLREHINAQLRDPASEILVLRDLKDITPLEFFFADPNLRLYQPVQVRPIDDGDRDLSRAFRDLLKRELPDPDRRPTELFDLTALLQVLIDRKDPRSVLMEARSGAGKTIAGIAAMLDCLYAAERPTPRLAGLLPCAVSVGGEERDATKGVAGVADAAVRAVAQALARTADSSGRLTAERVEAHLRAGPPLLLIVDLNAVGVEKRERFAGQLAEFLRSDTARRVGHRAVVTYRSHAEDDILETLRRVSWDERRTDDPIFLRADLEPMDFAAARTYLANLERVRARLDGRPDPDDAEIGRQAEIVR